MRVIQVRPGRGRPPQRRCVREQGSSEEPGTQPPWLRARRVRSRGRRCARGRGPLVTLLAGRSRPALLSSTGVVLGRSLHLSGSRPSPLSRKVLSLAGVRGRFPSSRPLSRERGAVCSPRAPSGRPKNGQSPAGGGEGPRPAPCRAGGLYKAVTPRTGQGPGSPALYESPHGSAKSFTLGWFAEAPLHPSGLIRPGPPGSGHSWCEGGSRTQQGRPGQGKKGTQIRAHSPLLCPRCGSRTDGPKNAG